MGEHLHQHPQQHGWACIVRKQSPHSTQLMEALSAVGHRTRSASNCVPVSDAERPGTRLMLVAEVGARTLKCFPVRPPLTRTRPAAQDVIASRAGRSAVAFLCSASDPGIADPDFSSRCVRS
jgi:hypothetical protein